LNLEAIRFVREAGADVARGAIKFDISTTRIGQSKQCQHSYATNSSMRNAGMAWGAKILRSPREREAVPDRGSGPRGLPGYLAYGL
jgi:hypothetical protein